MPFYFGTMGTWEGRSVRYIITTEFTYFVTHTCAGGTTVGVEQAVDWPRGNGGESGAVSEERIPTGETETLESRHAMMMKDMQ